MRSITDHLEPEHVAQQIRMERQAHFGAFMIVEGSTDIRRFEHFTDADECRIVNAFSRRNATGAAILLNAENFEGVLTCVDADFDRTLNKTPKIDNVIFSVFHDFDIEWATDEIVERYFKAIDSDKRISISNHEIMERIRPVSVLKLLVEKGLCKFSVGDMSIFRYIRDEEFLWEDFVAAVCRRFTHNNASIEFTKDQIKSESRNRHDLRYLTNGHDLFDAIGGIVRNLCGRSSRL